MIRLGSCLACAFRTTALSVLFVSAAWAQGETAPNADASGVSGSISARTLQADAGDTFASIARREFGKSGLGTLLAEFNGMQLDAVLAPGQTVRIPRHGFRREESATVVFVKGVVSRNDQPLLRDSAVVLGDQIETGLDGFVSLEFANGSVVNLQPGTQARIVKLNCLPDDDLCLVEIHSETGVVDADVTTGDAQPGEFTITTPYASAAVRGTEFGFDAGESRLLVNVTEGEVSLGAEGEDVDIPTGFGSTVVEGQAPSPPVPLLPPPVYRFVPVRIATGDVVELWPLTDSEGYFAKLTTDSAGRELVAQFEADDSTLTLPSLDASVYYLAVQGLDFQKLRGFESVTRITVADIDPALPEVNTRISREGQTLLVEVLDPPDGVAGYEIQLAETEDFSTPITVDVGSGGAARFRIDADVLFARARVLDDLLTVSAFGETAELR